MSRSWLVAGLLLAPLGWAVASALFDPAAQLLPPGDAGWLLDSRWRVKGEGGPCPPVRYRFVLEVARVPDTATIELTTPGEVRFAINRVPRFDSRSLRRRRWRQPIALDLSRWLEAGRNELLVQVHHERGAPVLRVSGAIDDASVASGRAEWWSDVVGQEWRPAVDAGGPLWVEAVERGEEHGAGSREGPPASALGTLAIAVPLVLVAAGLVLGRGRPAADIVSPPGWWRRNGPALALLVVGVGAHLHNAAGFPHDRSRLDWGGHVEHLRYNARTWRPPLATEGWEMYQPPLFYWVAGAVYEGAGGDLDRRAALRAVQLLNGVVGSATLGLGFLLLLRFGPPSGLARFLAMLAWGLSPMTLAISAMITNEPASGLVGGLALTVALFVLVRPRLGLWVGPVLGLLAGAALLTKFTGLMATTAIAAGLVTRAWTRPGERRRALLALLAFAVVVAATAGPYYLRNQRVFGKAFVGNFSPEVRYYEDDPGYRTAGFYLRFGGVLVAHPEQARWSSLWDGLYGSMWGEVHRSFVTYDDATVRRMLLVFGLMLGPTAAFLVGLLGSLRRATRVEDPERDARLVMLVVIACSVAAVAVFNMVVPFYACVKAFFMLHLVPLAVLLSADGWARIERGLGRGRWLLLVPAVAAATLVLDLYLWP